MANQIDTDPRQPVPAPDAAAERTAVYSPAQGADNTGVTSADAGQTSAEQRLSELGVPADLIRRDRLRREKKGQGAPLKVSADAPMNAPASASANAMNAPTNAPASAMNAPSAAEMTSGPGESASAEAGGAPSKPGWDEIMADPEYNRRMREIVSARVKKSRGAEEALNRLSPSIALLMRRYGLDAAAPDYDALNRAIGADLGSSDGFGAAVDRGTYPTAAPERVSERGTYPTAAPERVSNMPAPDRTSATAAYPPAPVPAETDDGAERRRFREHIAGLERQGEALKGSYPGFDLRTELQNPVFARMTSPNGGISVEDAYFAVHRKELQAAALRTAAESAARAADMTSRKLAASIRSGQSRPEEAGGSGQASFVTTFDYRSASREQRDALKKAIHTASARGVKLYPGT